ncbi:hypothetical protein [Pseudomonas fragi]|nr:hypothetical protein [Pseudomonas fragi]
MWLTTGKQFPGNGIEMLLKKLAHAQGPQRKIRHGSGFKKPYKHL